MSFYSRDFLSGEKLVQLIFDIGRKTFVEKMDEDRKSLEITIEPYCATSGFSSASAHSDGPDFQTKNKVNAGIHHHERNATSLPVLHSNLTVRKANEPEENSNIQPMSVEQLNHLFYYNPEKILCIILSEDSGFYSFLEQQSVSSYVLSLILRVVICALTSHMHHNVNAMINYVVKSDKFLFRKFSKFLLAFRNRPVNKQYHFESLLKISELLIKISTSVPLSYLEPLLDDIRENVRLLEKACEEYLLKDDQLYLLVTKHLRRLHDFLLEFKEELGFTKQPLLQNPSKDYRSIPVLPTIKDIHSSCTVLQPNLIRGRYENCEHYLDVQFRLCREDYIKTIRDGISEYLSLKKQGKPLNGCKDVRVYSDVCIVQQEFIHGELVHLARFSDERFFKIKWERSKRFLTGSLLCLSSDDFKSVLFATVVRRQAKELHEGLLLLRFEEVTFEVLSLLRLRRFVVIETSAYFEAYRHNLQALQELEVEAFPMKQYIVELQKNVLQPVYVTESTMYDIRPLLLPLNKSSIEQIAKECGVMKTVYKFDMLSDVKMLEKAKRVPIFNDQSWPSASELNLDPSQCAAIKAALTKRFALIQGPPGTGKTYIGLRIVQLLLHNVTNSQPIIVVCYTNHALDQFLEGSLQFTNRIVRIGGRGSNERLSQYYLHNLRKGLEQRKEVPNHLFKLIQQKKHELTHLIQSIRAIQQSIEMSYSTVLSEDILLKTSSISEKDYLDLQAYRPKNGEFRMHSWLGIPIGCKYLCQIQDNYKTNNSPIKCVDAKEDECDESEVEFIEAFRSISSEEYADFKIDVLTSEDECDQGIDPNSGNTEEGKYKQIIANNLTRVKAVPREEVDIEDIVWLPLIDRWSLYKYWVESHIYKNNEEIMKIQREIKMKLAELHELEYEVDLFLFQGAHVVGVTTTGAAKYQNLVKHLNPRIVVFEEAAEILESHIVTSLMPSTQHVILIGDHQQLKPSTSAHEFAVQYHLNVSLFERMVQNGMPCYRLNVQHRMHPEIAALLVPHFYEDLKNHELVMKYENMKGIYKNVFFITHNHNELQEFDSKSKVNQHEAHFLIKLCKYILKQGYTASQITILTTYSGQLLLLKKLANDDILKSVKLYVVDNYQGEENDIVLISFVRSNEDGEIGFLKVPNRVCVALSRAKKALYCVGNFNMLKEKSPIWKNVVQILEENQAIGPSLQVYCQNHPWVNNSVSFDKDFGEGGCTRICDFSLKCGHTCQLKCHPSNKKHENAKCLKACERRCDYGHYCKKFCFEDCGTCAVLVERRMVPCGHIIKVKCYMRCFREQKCTKRCEKSLVCGHQCQNICCSDCSSKCSEKKKMISPICGHTVEVECYNSEDFYYFAKICNEPCNQELSCGHKCQGTCGKCLQGRLHIPCTQHCERILICGHQCTSSCASNCPPCSYSCENRCSHGRCPRMCSEPCVKCHQHCVWSCPHQACNQSCAEICSRDICYELCPKILRCGHPCIGLCGELCPEECRECDKEKVQNAVYVRLEDCGHIFDLFGLMLYAKEFTQLPRKIQLITCPICNVVIRRNFCLQQVVKSCLEEVEKVKYMTCGNIPRNLYIQNTFMDKIKSNIHKIPEMGLSVMKALKSLYGRSIMEVIFIENIFTLAVSLTEGMNFFNNLPAVQEFSDSKMQVLYDQLFTYMTLNKKIFISFINDEFLTASHQQLEELNWEILRLKLADIFLKYICYNKNLKWNPELSTLAISIANFKPFQEENAKKPVAQLQALQPIFEEVWTDLSALAKPRSLTFLALSKDNWYLCPHQHPCFSTQPEGKCGKCGSKIGELNIGLQTGEATADETDSHSNAEFSVISERLQIF